MSESPGPPSIVRTVVPRTRLGGSTLLDGMLLAAAVPSDAQTAGERPRRPSDWRRLRRVVIDLATDVRTLSTTANAADRDSWRSKDLAMLRMASPWGAGACR